MTKEVKSDLKDVRPDESSDTTPRKPRQPTARGDRSDHVPRAISQGMNEQRGGRERAERRGEGAIAHARGQARHGHARHH